MRVYALLLSAVFMFSCAAEQSTRSVANSAETTSNEDLEEKSHSENVEKAELDAKDKEILDFYFAEDLAILEEILGIGASGDIGALTSKLAEVDYLSKLAFFKMFKADVASCMGLFVEFKSKEELFKSTILDLGLTELTLDKIKELDLNDLKLKLMTKSPVFIALALSKKPLFDSCVESVKSVIASKEVTDLKAKYLEEIKEKVSPYSSLKDISCDEKPEEPAVACVTNLDVACEVKDLFVEGKYNEAKDKLLGIDFSKITSCFSSL
jgi:hypothetical protein